MNNVRKLRNQLGLSQTALTVRSGIAQSTLSAIETGRLIPYPHQRERIAKALGVTVREIFSDEVSDPSNSTPCAQGSWRNTL